MSLQPWSVEVAMAALLVAVLVTDMADRHGTTSTWIVFTVGILAVLGIAVAARGDGVFANGAYTADGLSWITRILLVIGAGLAGALSLRGLPLRRKYHGAYAALLLAATLGMMVLVSSKDLVTLYVALETSAISLYGLSAIAKTEDFSLEAGIKYLITGALSSGILLYGLALIYTSTGASTLDGIRAVAAGGTPPILLVVGTLMVLLGIGFKLSMVPMHVWTPDVYQGAPTAVTAFISVVSKSAGFVFAIRLFSYGFADLRQYWEPALMVSAVLTMTLGNLAAIWQKSAKRLLAYSTISQAGYLLVGFLGTASTGTSAVLFYLFVYTLTNIAAFGAVIAFSNATGSDNLEDYAGLARREPVLALAFTFALLSMAGIPPLGGFIGKFYLFTSAMEKGYLWLVIVASLNSVVSLFYYLLVLRRMYIAEPAAAVPAGTVSAGAVLATAPRLRISLPVKVVLLLTTVAIFWLGILPGSLMALIGGSAARVFGGP